MALRRTTEEKGKGIASHSEEIRPHKIRIRAPEIDNSDDDGATLLHLSSGIDITSLLSTLTPRALTLPRVMLPESNFLRHRNRTTMITPNPPEPPVPPDPPPASLPSIQLPCSHHTRSRLALDSLENQTVTSPRLCTATHSLSISLSGKNETSMGPLFCLIVNHRLQAERTSLTTKHLIFSREKNPGHCSAVDEVFFPASHHAAKPNQETAPLLWASIITLVGLLSQKLSESIKYFSFLKSKLSAKPSRLLKLSAKLWFCTSYESFFGITGTATHLIGLTVLLFYDASTTGSSHYIHSIYIVVHTHNRYQPRDRDLTGTSHPQDHQIYMFVLQEETEITTMLPSYQNLRPPARQLLISVALHPWIVCHMWKARSVLVFENRRFTTSEVVSKILYDAKKWLEARQQPHLPPLSAVKHPTFHPSPSFISYYVDATWQASTFSCGMCWGFLDPSSSRVTQGSATHLFTYSALMGEVLALKTALEAALFMEIQHLNVFSDSLSLVSLINSTSAINELESVLFDIRCLIETFSSIFIFDAFHLSSVEADRLANLAMLFVNSAI